MTYRTDYAYSANQALQIFESDRFDAVVLAAKLPDIDGIRMTRLLRHSPNGAVPILMLGIENGVEAAVLGLNSGVDAYLKPGYDVREVEMRLRAIRMRRFKLAPRTLRFGELAFDWSTQQMWRNQSQLKLPRTQLHLLRMLMEAAPNAVSHRLLKSCLQMDNPHRCLLRTHISKLRRCLNRGFSTHVTISNEASGYRLRPP